MPLPTYRTGEFEAVIQEVADYVRSTHDRLYPRAAPLSDEQLRTYRPYLPPALLKKIRTLEPGGSPPLANPPFVHRARARGFVHMPDFLHLNEVTLDDLIVFQQEPTPRTFFHGLAHVAQYAALGVESYVRLYLEAFRRTGLHVTVPLEAHAYELDRRFAETPERPFSLMDEVRAWAEAGRYEPPAASTGKPVR